MSSSSIFDTWTRGREEWTKFKRPKIKAYVDTPPKRNIDDIEKTGARAFSRIGKKHGVNIARNDKTPDLFLITGDTLAAIMDGTEDVHREIEEQAEDQSFAIIQPSTILLAKLDVELEPVNKAREVVRALKDNTRSSSSIIPVASSKVLLGMPDFCSELRQAIHAIARKAVRHGEVGLKAKFGHAEMPRPKKLPQGAQDGNGMLCHRDFCRLVNNLGDRASVNDYIHSEEDIKGLLAYFQGLGKKEIKQSWSIAFPWGGYEIEVDLDTTNEDLSRATVLPCSYTVRNTETHEAPMTVICPQRRFDWALDTISEADQSMPGEAGKLVKTMTVVGVVGNDKCGKFPFLKVRILHPGIKGIPVYIRTQQRLRVLNYYWLQATISRYWNGFERMNKGVKADGVTAGITFFADSKKVTDAMVTGDTDTILKELLPTRGSMTGEEAFLQALEEAQATLDGLQNADFEG
ncbi:hypothetical protein MKZ38_002894 [Zalerion maritima]|uniref:Uncharacterized protein n=1 Tax=Zalerion maritima TaxID=339359 RepID=A0AAD5WS33_9PEZI|nr:hypothetical protein MKZ38_002894 [Zalerion maritima]